MCKKEVKREKEIIPVWVPKKRKFYQDLGIDERLINELYEYYEQDESIYHSEQDAIYSEYYEVIECGGCEMCDYLEDPEERKWLHLLSHGIMSEDQVERCKRVGISPDRAEFFINAFGAIDYNDF